MRKKSGLVRIVRKSLATVSGFYRKELGKRIQPSMKERNQLFQVGKT